MSNSRSDNADEKNAVSSNKSTRYFDATLNDEGVPEGFFCIITGELLIKDAWIAGDGYTYYGPFIREWRAKKPEVSPVHGGKMTNELIPNKELEAEIARFYKGRSSLEAKAVSVPSIVSSAPKQMRHIKLSHITAEVAAKMWPTRCSENEEENPLIRLALQDAKVDFSMYNCAGSIAFEVKENADHSTFSGFIKNVFRTSVDSDYEMLQVDHNDPIRRSVEFLLHQKIKWGPDCFRGPTMQGENYKRQVELVLPHGPCKQVEAQFATFTTNVTQPTEALCQELSLESKGLPSKGKVSEECEEAFRYIVSLPESRTIKNQPRMNIKADKFFEFFDSHRGLPLESPLYSNPKISAAFRAARNQKLATTWVKTHHIMRELALMYGTQPFIKTEVLGVDEKKENVYVKVQGIQLEDPTQFEHTVLLVNRSADTGDIARTYCSWEFRTGIIESIKDPEFKILSGYSEEECLAIYQNSFKNAHWLDDYKDCWQRGSLSKSNGHKPTYSYFLKQDVLKILDKIAKKSNQLISIVSYGQNNEVIALRVNAADQQAFAALKAKVLQLQPDKNPDAKEVSESRVLPAIDKAMELFERELKSDNQSRVIHGRIIIATCGRYTDRAPDATVASVYSPNEFGQVLRLNQIAACKLKNLKNAPPISVILSHARDENAISEVIARNTGGDFIQIGFIQRADASIANMSTALPSPLRIVDLGMHTIMSQFTETDLSLVPIPIHRNSVFSEVVLVPLKECMPVEGNNKMSRVHFDGLEPEDFDITRLASQETLQKQQITAAKIRCCQANIDVRSQISIEVNSTTLKEWARQAEKSSPTAARYFADAAEGAFLPPIIVEEVTTRRAPKYNRMRKFRTARARQTERTAEFELREYIIEQRLKQAFAGDRKENQPAQSSRSMTAGS